MCIYYVFVIEFQTKTQFNYFETRVIYNDETFIIEQQLRNVLTV